MAAARHALDTFGRVNSTLAGVALPHFSVKKET